MTTPVTQMLEELHSVESDEEMLDSDKELLEMAQEMMTYHGVMTPFLHDTVRRMYRQYIEGDV